MTEKLISRVSDFMPLASFIFFLSYVAFETVHLVHSPGWNWRRTAKGCLEAFAFCVIAFPVVAAMSFLSGRIATRFHFDPFIAARLPLYLSAAVLTPLLGY